MSENSLLSKTKSEIIFNDTYVAIQKIVQLSGIEVPGSVIRNYIAGIEGYPAISLYDIVEILIGIGGTPKVKRTAAAEIAAHLLPAIGHISCDHRNGVFITVIEADGEEITYLGPDNVLKVDSVSELEKTWSGIIIECEFNDPDLEDHTAVINKEKQAKQNYIDTISLTDHFIADKECDHIINLCEELSIFKRSLVQKLNDGDEGIKSQVRTSFSAILERDHQDETIREVYLKAAALAGEPADHIELIQCVRYAPGQEYRTHYDGDPVNQRIKTILVYLNEDFEGGETLFTEIDLKIKPAKGRALLFHNLDKEGNTIVESAHCGMPVVTGVKYAMNIWINTASAKHNF